jgi:hypothetical protein
VVPDQIDLRKTHVQQECSHLADTRSLYNAIHRDIRARFARLSLDCGGAWFSDDATTSIVRDNDKPLT